MLLFNCKYNHIFFKIVISLLLIFLFIPFYSFSNNIQLNSLNFSDINIKKTLNHSIGIKIENIDLCFNSNLSNSIQVQSDSTSKNRISRIWKSRTENYSVEIELDDYNSDIQITVYNMLGKEALEVYKGIPNKFDTKYDFSASNLPNGVYLCILVTKNTRKAEKFIVSR